MGSDKVRLVCVSGRRLFSIIPRRKQADGFDFRGDETAASEGKTTERRSRRVSAVMKTKAEETFAEVFCFVLEKKKF